MDKSGLLTATCTCLASVIVLICVAVPSEGIDAAGKVLIISKCDRHQIL